MIAQAVCAAAGVPRAHGSGLGTSTDRRGALSECTQRRGAPHDGGGGSAGGAHAGTGGACREDNLKGRSLYRVTRPARLQLSVVRVLAAAQIPSLAPDAVCGALDLLSHVHERTRGGCGRRWRWRRWWWRATARRAFSAVGVEIGVRGGAGSATHASRGVLPSSLHAQHLHPTSSASAGGCTPHPSTRSQVTIDGAAIG